MAPSRLALGTVQWGAHYGISNTTGAPSDQDLVAMVDAALAAGIDTLDTASAYGDAETRIGQVATLRDAVRSMRVVTKVLPTGDWTVADREALAHQVRAVARRGRDQLAPATVDTLLLHRDALRHAADGAAWDVLRSLREDGVVARIGVSAESPEAALDAVEDPDVDTMQVAASILDQRLARNGFFTAAAARGLEVHVRSTFLQGVAFLDPAALPPHLTAIAPQVAAIAELARDDGLTPATVWLQHGLTLPCERLVVGAETPAQVAGLGRMERTDAPARLAELAEAVPDLDASVLDPSQWPR